MIIGRLLVGISIGVASAIVPLYISEISPTEIRGALGHPSWRGDGTLSGLVLEVHACLLLVMLTVVKLARDGQLCDG
ncbi:hypothetical protein Fmac_007629 [Flemingia macrophylla]|uniref:Major facilitator superfamily (MFS) profile domain-containing protein n=1 Tax=Flemingia macrophylla TaxID=520843 RepID=A0ABD1MV68_9FABA